LEIKTKTLRKINKDTTGKVSLSYVAFAGISTHLLQETLLSCCRVTTLCNQEKGLFIINRDILPNFNSLCLEKGNV